MKGSGVVAVSSTNIVGSKNWDEDVELALIEKLVEGGEEGLRVDRGTSGARSDKERGRVRKNGIESSLRVQKFEGSKVGRGRGCSGGKDSRHTRGQSRDSRGSGSSTEDNKLKLFRGEKRKAIRGVVGNQVGRSGGGEGGFLGRRELLESIFGHDRGRFGRSGKMQATGNTVGRRVDTGHNRSGGKSLGEFEPKLTRVSGKRKARVDGGRLNGRAEGEVHNSRRTGGEISGDSLEDRGSQVIAEPKRVEVDNGEESGADKMADVGCFEGSVVGAVRDMVESCDEFSGAVERRMLDEQIGKEIETTGFEIGSRLDGRSEGHKKVNGIRGAAENEAGKGLRR